MCDSVEHICVAPLSGIDGGDGGNPNACKSNVECYAKNGGSPAICEKSTGACVALKTADDLIGLKKPPRCPSVGVGKK